MAFTNGENFVGYLRRFAQESVRVAAEEIIKKETEDFRRRIAKKVYKDIDNMATHFMEEMSPKTLTTRLHIGFSDKEKL